MRIEMGKMKPKKSVPLNSLPYGTVVRYPDDTTSFAIENDRVWMVSRGEKWDPKMKSINLINLVTGQCVTKHGESKVVILPATLNIAHEGS